jgi:hypothetical protein
LDLDDQCESEECSSKDEPVIDEELLPQSSSAKESQTYGDDSEDIQAPCDTDVQRTETADLGSHDLTDLLQKFMQGVLRA